MIAKTITYVDYDGNERKETFHFNISKAEFAEMDLSISGGFEAMLQVLIDKKDVPGMMRVFKELITKSYGVKSPDGRKMIKNKEVLDDFLQSEAYSELFMELCSDADKAIGFVRGIMPLNPDQDAEADAKLAELGYSAPALVE